jgi:hypothetical protein
MDTVAVKAPFTLGSSAGAHAAERDLFKTASPANKKKEWINAHSIFLVTLKHVGLKDTERYMTLTLCKGRVVFMDVITGSLYDPSTGACLSSSNLCINLDKLHMLTKQEEVDLLNYKPVNYVGEEGDE